MVFYNKPREFVSWFSHAATADNTGIVCTYFEERFGVRHAATVLVGTKLCHRETSISRLPMFQNRIIYKAVLFLAM